MIVRRPSFDVDTLEGAVLYFLSICHALSDVSLDYFVARYAYCRGKSLPNNYATTVLLPRLKRQHKIFQTTKHSFSLNPMVYYDENGLNSFWVFAHAMNDVDLKNVFVGEYPTQISYLKNGAMYNIICCKSDGSDEMFYEAGVLQSRAKTKIPKKYFFVFNDLDEMAKAKPILKAPTLFVSVTSDGPNNPPIVQFVNPKEKKQEGK